ncbi:uncharacterized protein LOC130139938 [Syzygium oleosum]|uniref:uncharacterized protein LOC130139938 n=1 Tax=Syzygium oleosum TaxID=219896 RepID=UPI0024B9F2C5|nr:uncharacterized protein LOC130139938 [Syzygium oleosum]
MAGQARRGTRPRPGTLGHGKGNGWARLGSGLGELGTAGRARRLLVAAKLLGELGGGGQSSGGSRNGGARRLDEAEPKQGRRRGGEKQGEGDGRAVARGGTVVSRAAGQGQTSWPAEPGRVGHGGELSCARTGSGRGRKTREGEGELGACGSDGAAAGEAAAPGGRSAEQWLG